jgi:hypothetical protein
MRLFSRLLTMGVSPVGRVACPLDPASPGRQAESGPGKRIVDPDSGRGGSLRGNSEAEPGAMVPFEKERKCRTSFTRIR